MMTSGVVLPPTDTLTPGRVVRDAFGLTWLVDDVPRWSGEQLRVRARLIRCDGVWGDLPIQGLQPLALCLTGR